jgi:signal transduction histidine kinase
MRETSSLRFVLGHAGHQMGSSSFSLSSRWQRLSLATQFTIVAAIVVGITMAVLGRWVAARIESGVITNTAASAALYMDRFVEPYVQELANGGTLSPASQNALDELAKTKGFGERILAVKIWRADGTIVYSTYPALIGKHLPVTDSLARALKGQVVAEFNELEDDENAIERSLGMSFLEIYSPVREADSGRIIAVVEFYQVADSFANQLTWAQLEGVLMVGGLSLLMLGALIGIVRRGSRTIISQQHALSARVSELSRSLALNEELRQRIADANRRSSESNERFLRRVSAELHDGPVQLLGLVLLRLDGLNAPADSRDGGCVAETIEIIRGALKDALTEIRGLSSGLALPELEGLDLHDAVELAVRNHERRTGTTVAISLPDTLPVIPASIKTCLYRFVQEGLNNAFRHAGGAGQRVALGWEEARLEIEVSDKGPGIAANGPSSSKSGIGLTGLRDRIESLGGTMLITSSAGHGTRLRASFQLNDPQPYE